MSIEEILNNSVAVVKSGLLPTSVIEITNAHYGQNHEPDFDEAVTNTASYEAGRMSVLTAMAENIGAFPITSKEHEKWLISEIAKNKMLTKRPSHDQPNKANTNNRIDRNLL